MNCLVSCLTLLLLLLALTNPQPTLQDQADQEQGEVLTEDPALHVKRSKFLNKNYLLYLRNKFHTFFPARSMKDRYKVTERIERSID